MGRVAYESGDIDVTMAQRRAANVEENFVAFQGIRAVGGSASGAFSYGAHSSRPSSGASGDQYLSTDRTTLYYYNGTKWLYLSGVNVGTNATRAAITVTADDNGSLFWTTDENKLWHVAGGIWVDRFVTLDLTTSLKVNSTKVIGARGAAVADVASADATDLATALTLVNEMKAQVNTAFARLRSTTGHGLWV